MTSNNEQQTFEWILAPGLRKSFDKFIKLYETVFKKPRNKKLLIVHGDPGVGKSLFTHVFETLYRRDRPNVKGHDVKRVNVSALTENLLLSELFGHVQGAFTGADRTKRGLVESAKLLVLEEIGELPKYVQAKLLTFAETGIYYPVGSEHEKRAKDIQIIATTNVEISEKNVRQDFIDRSYLFRVPALHERRGDVLYLLAHLYPDLLKMLVPWQVLAVLTYHWPGNMRELEKFGTMGLSDYHTDDVGDGRAVIKGTTAYCHNNFFAGELILRLRDYFSEMGLDLNFLESTMKKVRLSFNPTFRYSPTSFAGIPSFNKGKKIDPVPMGSFPRIGEIRKIESFEHTIDAIRFLALLMCVRFDAKLNLIDVNAIYSNPRNYSALPMMIPALNIMYGRRGVNWDDILRKAENYAEKRHFSQQSEPDIDLFSMHESNLLKKYYRELLVRSDGNVAEAARKTGMNYRTFRSRLKKYDIS